METALERVRRAIAMQPGWAELLDRLQPDIAPSAAEVRAALREAAETCTFSGRWSGRRTNVGCGLAVSLATLRRVAGRPDNSSRPAAGGDAASAPASPRVRTLIVDDSEAVRDRAEPAAASRARTASSSARSASPRRRSSSRGPCTPTWSCRTSRCPATTRSRSSATCRPAARGRPSSCSARSPTPRRRAGPSRPARSAGSSRTPSPSSSSRRCSAPPAARRIASRAPRRRAGRRPLTASPERARGAGRARLRGRDPARRAHAVGAPARASRASPAA